MLSGEKERKSKKGRNGWTDRQTDRERKRENEKKVIREIVLIRLPILNS